jgi:CheY-like chemotaxis protein
MENGGGTMRLETRFVLIADDDEELARHFAFRCQAAGMKARTAKNAVAAVEYLEECVPDLIIMDLELEAFDGLTLFQCLKSHDETRHIPTIVLCRNGCERNAGRDTCDTFYVYKSRQEWDRMELYISGLFDPKAGWRSCDHLPEIPGPTVLKPSDSS